MTYERTLPAESYLSLEQYEREWTALGGSWLFVGHEHNFRGRGATVAHSDLLGRPVLTRRGSDGALRSFYNVCRHRGGPVAAPGRQQCRQLKCLYHGWTYDDCGALSRTPNFDRGGITRLNAAELGLFPVRTDVWRGFVFVNFDDTAANLTESLGDLPGVLEDADLEGLEVGGSLSLTFACNWKLYVENWLESYHLPWLHKGLAQDVSLKEYRVELGDRIVWHTTAARRSDSIYGGLWVWLAPCVAWNFYENGVSVEQMLPTGPHTMRVDYEFLFRSDAEPSARARAVEMCEQVTREDGEMCEIVQRNLATTPFDNGPLSPNHEAGIAYFRDVVLGDSKL